MGMKHGVRIGKSLCELMGENKIKIGELAEMSDVSTATIGRARRNERIERSTAKKILDVFGVEYKCGYKKAPKKAEEKAEEKTRPIKIVLEIEANNINEILDKMVKIDSSYVNLLSLWYLRDDDGQVVFKSRVLDHFIRNVEKKSLREWIGDSL